MLIYIATCIRAIYDIHIDRIGYLFQNCVQNNNSWSQKQRENNNYYIL